MTSWPIVGHEWAVGLLEQSMRANRVGHAYLFTGPPHIGKTALAMAFAQALVCQRRAGYPCGECGACLRILDARYPDVQCIAAQKTAIQIDQVRSLQADAALSPLEGRYKVFVIQEIERATPPAANALLKILEEPPPHVILLLTTSRRDRVLPTVVSRCQVMDLRPLAQAQVQEALVRRWSAEPDQALLLSRLSCGALGWAVGVLGDVNHWQIRTRLLDEFQSFAARDVLQRLSYADALSRQKDDLETVLGMWTTWWRDVLLMQQGLADAIVNLDRRAQLAQQADLHSPEAVAGALKDLSETFRRLNANVNTRLALDVLMLRLPAPAAA